MFDIRIYTEQVNYFSCRHGILGIDRLLNFLLQEWLQDIKKNQLPTILSGVGPLYTFVQLCNKFCSLFLFKMLSKIDFNILMCFFFLSIFSSRYSRSILVTN